MIEMIDITEMIDEMHQDMEIGMIGIDMKREEDTMTDAVIVEMTVETIKEKNSGKITKTDATLERKMKAGLVTRNLIMTLKTKLGNQKNQNLLDSMSQNHKELVMTMLGIRLSTLFLLIIN